MNGRMMLAQPQQTAYKLTIKNGQAVSYPYPITLIEGVGGRGLQWLFDESVGWTAADLVPYFSDNAYVDAGSADEALKRGDYQDVLKTIAAVWWPLEDKTGTAIRIASIPTAAGANWHLRALHSEFWVLGTWKYVRFISTNTASLAQVNQGADRTFWIKPLY